MGKQTDYLKLNAYIGKVWQNKRNKLLVAAVGSFIIVAYHLFIGAFLEVPGLEIVRSSLMQIFGILIPGLALYCLLYKRAQTLLGALFMSYILGYATNIVSYFLLVPVGLKAVAPCFVAILSAVSVVVILRQSGDIERKREKGDFLYWIGFALFLYVNILAYSAANTAPTAQQSTWLPTDFLFWIENSCTLAAGFPPTNPRVYVGETMYYHYFSSIQVAFLNLATGIDCFTLSAPLFALGKSLVFYGAVYLFFCGLTKQHWLRILGALTVLFATANEGISVTTYISHIWIHPFGFDIGFAFGLVFLHCFYLQLDREEFDWRVLLLSVLTVGICTGAKAPVAVVVIATAGIVCICWLFQRKWKHAFGYGIGILAVFALISVFCVGIGISSSDSRIGGFSMWATLRDDTPFLGQLYGMLAEPIPEIIKLGIMFLMYYLCAGPLTYGVVFVAAPFVATDKKLRTAQNAGLLFGALLGMALGVFNIQWGHSQMYFAMSAVIPCVTLGIVFLDRKLTEESMGGKVATVLILGSLLLFQTACGMLQAHTYYGHGLVPSLRRGHTVLFSNETVSGAQGASGLHAEDLEALAWIRDNTPRDSVVLTDRSVIANMPDYMYYGVFSERQMYLEGDTYSRDRYLVEREHMRGVITGVYQNSEEALQTAIDEGVDYIVQTVWLTPEFQGNTEKLMLVFSSETINVYEVKK